MENSEEKKSEIEKAGEDLFEFAIDREDVKWLMAHLSGAADVKRNTVEYELQILKIVSVGWSISYHLENSPCKKGLSELYWMAIHEFSRNLSETTELLAGCDIDYFQILRERLDTYVKAMSEKPEGTEPVAAIGPEFAKTCGNADDIFVQMTGSKMFASVIANVRRYLVETKMI